MGEAARYAGRSGRGLRPGGAAGPLRRGAALAGACALALFGGTAAAPAAQAGTVPGAAPVLAPQAGPAAAVPAAAASGAGRLPGASRPSARYPVSLAIGSVSPSHLSGRDAKVTVSGTVTNGGRRVVHGAAVGLRTGTGQPLRIRSQIAIVAGRTDPVMGDGQAVPGVGSALADLAPGATRPFTVTAKASQLGLSDNGVYELAVDVHGPAQAAGALPGTLGIARTFLPYYPAPGDIPRTRIATVWPVTDAPQLVPQTLADTTQSPVPVLRGDGMAEELAPGGRLNELVTAGGSLSKVTWAVDGDLLDTAAAMQKPYQVQNKGTQGEAATRADTTPGTGGDRAATWLAMLRNAVRGNEVVALPYADPDLASVAHNGRGVAGLDTALKRSVAAGDVTTEYQLATDARNDVAWPYQGHVDPQVVGTARTTGSRLLLVNGADMPEAGSVTHTANAARPIGGGMTAVVSDAAASGLFTGNLGTQAARRLAVQRFLAETLTITLEQPNLQRSILVMPPRGMSADAADTLAEALSQATAGKWATQATLSTVARAPKDPAATTRVPSAARYPRAARATELSHAALSQIMGTQRGLDRLMEVLTQPERVRGPFNRAILRATSTAWRTDRPGGRAYRDGVGDYLGTLTSAVRLVKKSDTTLSGDSGMIQVSVENGLTQPVRNLEVRLTAVPSTYLTVYRPTPETLDIDSEVKKSVRFPAKASVNSTVHMTAQLWTTGDDPQAYGDPVEFDLKVTDVSSGVLWVIAGGVVLVLLAGVRIYLQRRKRGDDGTEPASEGAERPDGGADPAGPRPGTVGEDSPRDDARAGGSRAGGSAAGGGEDAEHPARNEKVGP
ncbi:hypothetical protein LO771_07135 [Streptacidiphilus sp. ASG 303]|uniref:DUF6049 family protein n=1 Tax=Streptacidiphilus sp. ASG 303 TaxID=2896847 RepID=UPI001E3FB17B|nr:DUF6049 family protein [Streptacidiphilus sp. ASG 303]MCD0482192.1 hypothetical protein [Streptacidiphilus sp. ASG 303]